MKLAQALLLIPPGTYLKCGCEKNPETAGCLGSARLFTEPPENGWPDPRHPADTFRDQIIAAITTDETDYQAFESLIVHMIVDRYGTALQKHEARAQLDQHARQCAQQTTTLKRNWL